MTEGGRTKTNPGKFYVSGSQPVVRDPRLGRLTIYRGRLGPSETVKQSCQCTRENLLSSLPAIQPKFTSMSVTDSESSVLQ